VLNRAFTDNTVKSRAELAMARLSTFCIVAAVFLAATCALAVHVDVNALATTARRARHHHAAAMLGASRGKVHKKFTTDACKNFARFSSVAMLKEVADEIVSLHWTLDATPTTVQTAEAKSTFRFTPLSSPYAIAAERLGLSMYTVVVQIQGHMYIL